MQPTYLKTLNLKFLTCTIRIIIPTSPTSKSFERLVWDYMFRRALSVTIPQGIIIIPKRLIYVLFIDLLTKRIPQTSPRYSEAVSGLPFWLWFTGRWTMLEEIYEKSPLHNPHPVAYFLSFLTPLTRYQQRCLTPFWTASYPLMVWMYGGSHWQKAHILSVCIKPLTHYNPLCLDYCLNC